MSKDGRMAISSGNAPSGQSGDGEDSPQSAWQKPAELRESKELERSPEVRQPPWALQLSEPREPAPRQSAPAPAEPWAVPSWARVLGTTIWLWVQRRAPGYRSRQPGERRPGDGRPGDGRPAERAPIRRLTAVVIALACIAAALAVVLFTGVLTRPRTAQTTGQDSSGGSGARAMAAVAASRQQAASWIVGQVSRAAIVACDPVMCSALQARGFPIANLMVLGPTSNDPLGSAIVVGTAAVRSQFGSRLAQVYAPEVLASFGSGAARIDVRAIALYGASAYEVALHADMLARRQSGGQLVRNPNLQGSAAARRQLQAGQVEERLMITLAALTAQRRVDVLAFGDAGPRASQGVPLRSAELAVVGSGASGRGYLSWLMRFLDNQRAPYRAASMRELQVSGHTVVSIEFSAPSPLGLLSQSLP